MSRAAVAPQLRDTVSYSNARPEMLTPLQPVVPPAPKVHDKDLPGWQALYKFNRNTLSSQPQRAFDEPVIRRCIFGLESLLINDPDGVRHVLATAMDKYKRLVAADRILGPLGGTGLFLAAGSQWRQQRRMLAPMFTPANVGLSLPHFMAAALGLANRIAGAHSTNLCANLSLAFQEATREAVLRALFSLPDSAERARITAMVRYYLAGPGRPNLFDAFAPTTGSFGFALRSRRRFQKEWSATIDAIVSARRERRGTAASADLLDLLLAARDPETGQALSQVEVRDQCSTMIVAGYETTARLLFWATYLLTLDLAEQHRLRAELVSFPPERVSSLDDLLNWPRLRQVLFEALRLYPPAAYISREAIADDVFAGEPVRAGTQAWISPWVLHRHRKHWDNPTAFTPDRFTGKLSPWTGGGAFLPFGAGPRICIGATFAMAEAHIMLATLLSRFRITLDAARPVLPVARITTAPSYEPSFRLERI
jgi:cytochrome P450